MEGQKAEFVCTVSKDTFEVKWMKGDQELEAGDKYQMLSDGKRRTLVVKSCEMKDEGGYVAKIGTTRASADLTVLGTPSKLDKQPAFEMLLFSDRLVCKKYMLVDSFKS